jgi:hypothetical protein
LAELSPVLTDVLCRRRCCRSATGVLDDIACCDPGLPSRFASQPNPVHPCCSGEFDISHSSPFPPCSRPMLRGRRQP